MAFPDTYIDDGDPASEIRTLLNAAISTQGLLATGTTASVANINTGTWTSVPLTSVTAGNSGASLNSGQIAIPTAANGLWQMICYVSWKNDHAALAKHRRRIRLVANTIGLVEGQEMLFDPDMGDLGTVSNHSAIAFVLSPFFGQTRFGIQVWQNSGDTVSITKAEMVIVRAGPQQ